MRYFILSLLASALIAHADARRKTIDTSVVIDTTVCELRTNPEQFDDKLVRVKAYVSRGFENSSLSDPNCVGEAFVNWRRERDESAPIWVDDDDHPGWGKVKDYAPTERDSNFHLLQKMLADRHGHQMVFAVLQGSFYAGKQIEINGKKTSLRGFGHMGCCSLFVTHEVESIKTEYAADLNYSDGGGYIGLKDDCYTDQMLGLPLTGTIREQQRATNSGREAWRFDASKVAEEELHEILSGEFGRVTGGTTTLLQPGKSALKPRKDEIPVEKLVQIGSGPGARTFEWLCPDQITHIVIAVSRPYWLEEAAGSPDKVIWAATGASAMQCVSKKH